MKFTLEIKKVSFLFLDAIKNFDFTFGFQNNFIIVFQEQRGMPAKKPPADYFL